MASTDTVPGKLPEHEATYRRLRDMVMFGELVPGQKVTIQGITAALGAGMTPSREAIRRLTAEGALVLHENRRVSVPRLTPSQADELAFARLALEPRLAELAMPRLDAAAIDRLEALDAAVDEAIDSGDVRAYLAGNHRFHFALYEAAAAPSPDLADAFAVAALRAVPARGDDLGRRDRPRPPQGSHRGDAGRGWQGTGGGDRGRHPAGYRPRPRRSARAPTLRRAPLAGPGGFSTPGPPESTFRKVRGLNPFLTPVFAPQVSRGAGGLAPRGGAGKRGPLI